MPTVEERDEYLRQEARTLVPGEIIEIRRDESRYQIDDVPFAEVAAPKYVWHRYTIIEILDPTPYGDVVVKLRDADGDIRPWPLITLWRRKTDA